MVRMGRLRPKAGKGLATGLRADWDPGLGLAVRPSLHPSLLSSGLLRFLVLLLKKQRCFPKGMGGSAACTLGLVEGTGVPWWQGCDKSLVLGLVPVCLGEPFLSLDPFWGQGRCRGPRVEVDESWPRPGGSQRSWKTLLLHPCAAGSPGGETEAQTSEVAHTRAQAGRELRLPNPAWGSRSTVSSLHCGVCG